MENDSFEKLMYSIIIPHKNIPHLLQRCLDSIPQRKDVQIIIIDDDSSPEIVDFVHFPGQNRTDVEVVLQRRRKEQAMPVIADLKRLEGNGYYLQMLMISFYRVFGIRWIFTVILIMT